MAESTKVVMISEDDFFSIYKPKKNHLVKSCSWNDCMYETYGEELDFIRSVPAESVWTIIETDGNMAVVAGFHYVNRIGYLLTEKHWTLGTEEVDIDNDFD